MLDIKLHMDKLHGPAWHCIVGKGFGSAVTYNNKNFLYLYLGNKAIMLFRHWFHCLSYLFIHSAVTYFQARLINLGKFIVNINSYWYQG